MGGGTSACQCMFNSIPPHNGRTSTHTHSPHHRPPHSPCHHPCYRPCHRPCHHHRRSLSSTATTATAVAVAIATTATTCLCFACCWLVVALFSAIRFRHCTPSCNHQCSCCRPLSLPIVVHHRHCRRCHCRRATTAATATAATATTTTVVELTIVLCQRKRQQQHHHQRTNGSTNVKTFINPVNLDLFKLIYSI